MRFGLIDTPLFIAFGGFLFGIFQFGKLKHWERLILLVLLLNVVVDLIAIRLTVLNKQTVFCYNIYVPIEFLIMLLVYYLYLKPGKTRRMLVYVIPLVVLYAVFNGLFLQDINNEFASYTFFIGGFIIALFSYLIWKQEVQEKDIDSRNIILWFSAANFLYFIITIPALSANNWLVVHDTDKALPVQIINVVMYGIFSIIISLGFIWHQKGTI